MADIDRCVKFQPATMDDFDIFYAAYPKKKGKLAAIRRWAKMKERPPLDVLLAAIEAQKKSKQWLQDNGQYIKHPATWLHDGAWEDEVEEQQQAEHASRIAEERVLAEQNQLAQRLAVKLGAEAEAAKNIECYDSMLLPQRQYWAGQANRGRRPALRGDVLKRVAGELARKDS